MYLDNPSSRDYRVHYDLKAAHNNTNSDNSNSPFHQHHNHHNYSNSRRHSNSHGNWNNGGGSSVNIRYPQWRNQSPYSTGMNTSSGGGDGAAALEESGPVYHHSLSRHYGGHQGGRIPSSEYHHSIGSSGTVFHGRGGSGGNESSSYYKDNGRYGGNSNNGGFIVNPSTGGSKASGHQDTMQQLPHSPYKNSNSSSNNRQQHQGGCTIDPLHRSSTFNNSIQNNSSDMFNRNVYNRPSPTQAPHSKPSVHYCSNRSGGVGPGHNNIHSYNKSSMYQQQQQQHSHHNHNHNGQYDYMNTYEKYNCHEGGARGSGGVISSHRNSTGYRGFIPHHHDYYMKGSGGGGANRKSYGSGSYHPSYRNGCGDGGSSKHHKTQRRDHRGNHDKRYLLGPMPQSKKWGGTAESPVNCNPEVSIRTAASKAKGCEEMVLRDDVECIDITIGDAVAVPVASTVDLTIEGKEVVTTTRTTTEEDSVIKTTTNNHQEDAQEEIHRQEVIEIGSDSETRHQ